MYVAFFLIFFLPLFLSSLISVFPSLNNSLFSLFIYLVGKVFPVCYILHISKLFIDFFRFFIIVTCSLSLSLSLSVSVSYFSSFSLCFDTFRLTH